MTRFTMKLLNLVSAIARKSAFRNVKLPQRTFFTSATYSYRSVYEPEYLSQLVPEIPLNGLLNIQMKGYDFTVLEHYSKYVVNLAKNMNIEVEDSWPVPGKDLQIVTYKPHSTVVDSSYELTHYERNVEISGISSILLPVFLQVLQSTLPVGVELQVRPHDTAYEEIRYIPDLELLELRKQLDEIKSPPTTPHRKK